jgi:sortase A
MRYRYDRRIRPARRIGWLSITPLILGVYVLLNAGSPMLPTSLAPKQLEKKVYAQAPLLSENRLYIPAIGVDVAVVQAQGNETKALELGAVQRQPQNGNPRDGGNFVLAAHRFNMGYTPWSTRAKSPFYHIDKLQVSDQIFVDYDSKRYLYEVTGKQHVAPDASDIESRTKDARITLYSCELAGSKAGREVVIAKLQGQLIWKDGDYRLQKPSTPQNQP